MPQPSLEEYKAACKIIDEWSHNEETQWLDPLTELRGILKALRFMLRTEEGQSVLERCATVVRRHDQMFRELGHYGRVKAEVSEGTVTIKTEDGQHG